MPVILAIPEAESRRITVQSQPKQIVHETLSRKKKIQKSAGEVAQVPSKHETLYSNPSVAKKKKK
jgi:hypothetical protein